MNATERIRAYLDARAQGTPDPADTFARQGLIARQGDAYLREVDLEVVLQMLDLLARVASQSWSGGAVTPGDIQKLIERQVTDQ